MRTRRADATLVREVPATRRIMPYVMRGRNESVVYFRQEVDLTRTEEFISSFNRANGGLKITLFHLVVWAAARVLDERPRLNRFVAGGRLWQRDGIWISFSAKKQLSDDAPIVAVKRRFDPDQPFRIMVKEMAEDVGAARSSDRSYTDRELDLLLRTPGVLLRGLTALQRGADALGLLPRSYIENDPLYASLFVANLGSLKMDAAYHHLWEYGNITIFCVIGRTYERPVVIDGKVTARRTAVLKYSFDERVEDGLYANAALERLREIVEDPLSGGADD
ncbi:MAG: 2-oxo acid dehydrogenase subunit E2 [Actinomycetota bacterium]|nr:2-oxo acid dehydrogenase subunit E2 [Actinomycetota bacterium]